MSCESNKISVSYKHTWVSYGITLSGAIITFLVGYDRISGFGRHLERAFGVALVVLISWVLIIVILPILLGFVQGVDKFCNFLCKCCPTKCFPVVERTELDVDNMD